MTDPDARIRAALTRLLQRCRTVPSVPGWVDEAVGEIRAASGAPDGMVTADGPEAAGALAGLKERAEGMERYRDLAAEMLESFAEGRNGWAARVSAAKVEQWRERLGEQE
jgi:hypothetical protein